MIGKRYGRLVVLERADDYITPSGKHETGVWCRCDCGNIKRVRSAVLRSGNTRSCGCLRNEMSGSRLRVHGDTQSCLHKKWASMLNRCRNKREKNYGAKGICVCEEWLDYTNFKKWAEDSGYRDGLTIDRIDNSKGYFPDNCRWADRKAQNNNTSRNHWITFNGETKTMAQWSEVTGISYHAIKSRLNKHGWSVERALTTPAAH